MPGTPARRAVPSCSLSNPSKRVSSSDRHTGTLTEWPPLDTGMLATKYHAYKRGAL